MLAAAGCLSLTSCSNDDDNNQVQLNPPPTQNANADLVGTYRMTSWNSPSSIDFDGDGTSNTNMMNESQCYSNSTMSINNNGTYTMTYNYMDINNGTVTCGTESTNGTWVRNGNSFTTTHMSGGENMNTNYNFAANNSTTLTRNMTNWNYPSMDEDGNAMFSQGNVSMIMTRD